MNNSNLYWNSNYFSKNCSRAIPRCAIKGPRTAYESGYSLFRNERNEVSGYRVSVRTPSYSIVLYESFEICNAVQIGQIVVGLCSIKGTHTVLCTVQVTTIGSNTTSISSPNCFIISYFSHLSTKSHVHIIKNSSGVIS